MKIKPNINLYADIYFLAAQQLGLKTNIIQSRDLIEVSHNGKNLRILRSLPEINTAVSLQIANDKVLTNQLLTKHNLPCPHQATFWTQPQAIELSEKIAFPLVVKPIQSEKGRGVTSNITTPQELNTATAHAKKYSMAKHKLLIMESFHQGLDYRFLVFNNQVLGVVRRDPPTVTGDGQSTIKQLLITNSKIRSDSELNRVLKSQNLSLDSIIPPNSTIQLRQNANVSSGGTATTIDNQNIHPQTIQIAIDAAKTIGTHLAGVDILIKDPHQPPQENAVVIEINASPGLSIHHAPSHGQPQLVAQKILKSYFHL